ncbi:alkyl hydroperoxide reductase subunit F [Corynebacterium choanae]|uniref:alkyl hydroperoxide reductase subunit F n=1 Tax=Corynebacterium choanae TaxID=1862358 RepID=UPI000F4EBA1D|nr:alkyl hydroperoxide reductase subunit F [Corynebacterium choanae]
MLSEALQQQVQSLTKLIKRPVVLQASLGDDDRSAKMRTLLEEVAAVSSAITVEEVADERTPSFAVTTPEAEISIRFAGLPMGHEFESFMLALVQVGGHPPKLDDEVKAAIQSLDGTYNFVTYMSLTCQNCPEVVQSLNMMAVLNPNITHVAVEGGAFEDEVKDRGVMSVPAVFLNGEAFGQGRMSVGDILPKLDHGQAAKQAEKWRSEEPFDILVCGAGPAGVAAAVYAARKGLRTGMVAERVGGQVLDTMAIENLIAIPHTEGPKLGSSLKQSATGAGVVVMEPLSVSGLSPKGDDGLLTVYCQDEVDLKAKAVIVATGAAYRTLGVPGEDEYRNKGVTFCPHCDGPLFKGQPVAVVGGGNSGVEAAIDLANICPEVHVVEFLSECRADKVLLDAAEKTGKITFHTNSAVQEITGNANAVTGLTYVERDSDTATTLQVQGVFIQVGLIPRTDWLQGSGLEITDRGEVTIDARGVTNIEGVFAAGDCATTPYKQIVTAFGSGANASLSAFEYIAMGR